MRHLAKRFLIVFLALWLPVSVVAAGAFTVSLTSGASQEAVAAHHGEACAERLGAAGDESAPPSPDKCLNCAVCHFACTALMSVPVSAGTVSPIWIAAEFSPFVQRLHVADRLQRPPLARAA